MRQNAILSRAPLDVCVGESETNTCWYLVISVQVAYYGVNYSVKEMLLSLAFKYQTGTKMSVECHYRYEHPTPTPMWSIHSTLWLRRVVFK